MITTGAVSKEKGTKDKSDFWDQIFDDLVQAENKKAEVNYVRPPENHIVIDFDSKSGNAVHLHKKYEGGKDNVKKI